MIYYVTFENSNQVVIVSIFAEQAEKIQFTLHPTTQRLSKKQCQCISTLLEKHTLLLFKNEKERDRFAVSAAKIPFRIKKNSLILPVFLKAHLEASPLAVAEALAMEGYTSEENLIRRCNNRDKIID